jgi:hypothetical protein
MSDELDAVFIDGYHAAEQGLPKAAPNGLTPEQSKVWLEGWDWGDEYRASRKAVKRLRQKMGVG